MVDEQPRWPAGTPIAPGGHGPGGGRWMRVRGADLPDLLTGGGDWIIRSLASGGHLSSGASLVADAAHHATNSQGEPTIRLTRRRGPQTGHALPGSEYDVVPAAQEDWVGRVASEMPGGVGVLPASAIEQRDPNGRLGTIREIADLMQQGHRVQVRYGDAVQQEGEWLDVTGADVHVSGTDQSGLFTPRTLLLTQPIHQYRLHDHGQPMRVTRFDEQAFPGLPEGQDRRREEAMYALGAATRHHQLQVKALLAHYGLGNEDSDVRDALAAPREPAVQGLNFNIDWDEAGAILDSHLSALLLSGRIDVPAIVKIYRKAKAGSQQERAVVRELEIGVLNSDAQHEYVRQGVAYAVEHGLVPADMDPADLENAYYDFYEPLDWLQSFPARSRNWQQRAWKDISEALSDGTDDEEGW